MNSTLLHCLFEFRLSIFNLSPKYRFWTILKGEKTPRVYKGRK